MVIEKRARSREQKAHRRQQIMAAAAGLLGENAFRAISMARVARRAGMAKGTVFLYFKTKEALFLAITVEQFQSWFNAMDQALEGMAASKRKTTNQSLLKCLQTLFEAHPLLPKLVAIMHILLEHNVTYDEARTFKQMLAQRLPRTGSLLEACLAHLKPGQGAKFILWLSAFVIGLTHMAEPAPVIQELYRREPGLRMFQVDFDAHFFDALETLLDGWEAQSK